MGKENNDKDKINNKDGDSAGKDGPSMDAKPILDNPMEKRLARRNYVFDKSKSRRLEMCDAGNEHVTDSKSTPDIGIGGIEKDDATLSSIITDMAKCEEEWGNIPSSASELNPTPVDKILIFCATMLEFGFLYTTFA